MSVNSFFVQDWKWSYIDVAGTAPPSNIDLTAKAIPSGKIVLGGNNLCQCDDMQIYNMESKENEFQWEQIQKIPLFWELQLLDTPFRKISDVADLKLEGEVSSQRIGSAVGTSMGRLYIFSGKIIDDEDVVVHMTSIVVLGVEPDNTVSVMTVEKPDGDAVWPEARTGAQIFWITNCFGDIISFFCSNQLPEVEIKPLKFVDRSYV